MDWVNYHHLFYFRTVAREGSISRASKLLLLAQPTISGQIRALEETLGEKLFARAGRNLVLTDFGHIVYRYADEIFSLGQEMTDVLKGRPSGRPARLTVGISHALPRLVANRLLTPATESVEEPVQLICHEDRTENLAAALQTQGLDLALTNAPITPSGSGWMKVVNHLLGTSTISVFGTQDVAARLRKKFPKSLHESPMLLPMENSVLRRALDHWFAQNEITPRVFGEFQDSGLLKTFAVTGCGVFFAPSVIEKDIRNLYRLAVIGRIPELHEHFYAVSVERRFKNTAAARIIETARAKFFGNDGGAEER